MTKIAKRLKYAIAILCAFFLAFFFFHKRPVPSQHSGPRTPSAKMGAPYPPREQGCNHLVDGKWQKVPCASEEFIRKHPHSSPSKPVVANSIQSNPKTGLAGCSNYTVPFIWGSVSINFLSDASQAAEKDVLGTSSTANAFSIQDNTNFFPCSSCSNGQPFAAVPGVANSASQAGDTGWVQFVFQSDYGLCVWNVDVTVANNTANQAGYQSSCVNFTDGYPLTGNGAAQGGMEVLGYINCPTAGSNSGCLLQAMGYFPLAGGWWNVSAPDSMGLNRNWTNVSGTILGRGNGSQAVFTSTQIEQVVRGYSCFEAPQAANGFTPVACPPPNTGMALLTDLNAAPASTFPTGETNNLTNGAATFQCEDFDCWLQYNSSAP